MSWLAFDIGGANLKVADGRGYACREPFALWRTPQRLAAMLAGLIEAAPAASHLAATMTGELADCFRTKPEGVRHIVGALQEAAGQRQAYIYLCDGRLVPLDTARQQPQQAAASNWHVLARFAARYARVPAALLLDIGSTTTDIVPLRAGKPASGAFTDTGRLLAGELVYTGVERSPVCAVVNALPLDGRRCPVAQEYFATMLDVYLLLGNLPEEDTGTATADSRPATRQYARERLARCICADRDSFSEPQAAAAAAAVAQAQRALIEGAIGQVMENFPAPLDTIVISGKGEFLARQVIQSFGFAGKIVSLEAMLGTLASTCATAHALAVVAREELG